MAPEPVSRCNVSNGSLYNYTNSIPPGTTVILYGSGLGADPKPARDTTYVAVTSAVADSINALTHIYVGGVDGGPPGYQGASGYPGLNQINFTIPANAPTGCSISLVGVNALGVPTNIVSLPVGTGTCSDPFFGTNGTQLQTPSGQTTVTSGALDISQTTASEVGGKGPTTFAEAVGDFQSSPVPSYGTSGVLSIGDCGVTQIAITAGSSGTSTGLDAGTITLTNPSGSVVNVTTELFGTGNYSAELTSGYIPATGGTFTFQGMGGANVGPFTATVTFPNSVLTWTNQSAAATVTRSSGLPITWTGGDSGTYVVISGYSSSAAGATGFFRCLAPINVGQFTVPTYILNALPPGTGTGSVTVENSTVNQTFTAPGLDNGSAFGYVATQILNSTFN